MATSEPEPADDVDVKLPDDRPYQVLPPLSDEEYAALEADICRNGIQDPVTVDEKGVPIDGYNRAEIALENDLEIPHNVVSGLSGQEKRDLAYRLNLNRRHMEHGQKQEIVEQYLLEDWDGDNTGEWYGEVASTLGVGGSTVRKVFTDLRADGKLVIHGILSKEERRRQVREYASENPDASDREVARNIEADVSHPTIGSWREEWKSGDEDDAGDGEPDAGDDPDEAATDTGGSGEVVEEAIEDGE